MSRKSKLVSLCATATARMPAKASAPSAQQTLSSFFKPATQPQKRPPTDEVLILDSDDDDEVVSGLRTHASMQAGTSKRVKTEHDTAATQLSPIASTSKLPSCAATSSLAARSGVQSKAPSASAKRIREYAYVEGKERTPRAVPSDADKARHDAFVKRLSLGPNLLQKRSSYLQKEHHLAASGDQDDEEGGNNPLSNGFLADPPLPEGLLEEESDDNEGSPRSDHRSNGKGKAREATPSRFAKFAAKGKSTATSPGDDITKYTPLEKQVLALRKANPGVLLIIEVSPKSSSNSRLRTQR